MFRPKTNDDGGDRRAVKRAHHRTHGRHERHERERKGRKEVENDVEEQRRVESDGMVAEWVEVVASVGTRERGGNLPWRKHAIVENWLKENLGGVPRSGAGRALVVVGPRLAGKTTWARSLGEHVYMVGLHSGAAADVCNEGHVVCDDLTKDYPYAKQVLTCQPVVCMARDDGMIVQKKWGKPCIWLCDQWDDPRLWSPEMAGFVSQACTVFDMNEHGWKTMYVEQGDVDKEAVDGPALFRSSEADKEKEEKEEKEEKQKPNPVPKHGKQGNEGRVTIKLDDALDYFK